MTTWLHRPPTNVTLQPEAIAAIPTGLVSTATNEEKHAKCIQDGAEAAQRMLLSSQGTPQQEEGHENQMPLQHLV